MEYKTKKDVKVKLEPMRLGISMKKHSIIAEHIKTRPFIVLLNILIIFFLFYLSFLIGSAVVIIEIVLLFLIPSSKEKIKEITHL
mgnify:CR=1 FL=1